MGRGWLRVTVPTEDGAEAELTLPGHGLQEFAVIVPRPGKYLDVGRRSEEELTDWPNCADVEDLDSHLFDENRAGARSPWEDNTQVEPVDDGLARWIANESNTGIASGDLFNWQDKKNTSFSDDSEGFTTPHIVTPRIDNQMKRSGCMSGLDRISAPAIDPEETKAKVRKNLFKKEFSSQDFYHKVGLWQKIARSAVFEQLTLGVIMVNAVWIAVDTDRNDAETLLEAHPVFQVMEHFFCSYFSFEWFVRFMAFKLKRNCFLDRWFLFDSCLVAMMVGETWVVTICLVVLGNGDGGGSPLGNAAILRLFRLLRLTRMARMLRAFPELMILVKGMTFAMRSVMLVMVLLGIFMYIFAIAFTQLAEDTEVIGERYFSSVFKSMYTLLVYGTFLDNLAQVCWDLKQDSFVVLSLFFVFIFLAALTLLNMLIGVLCEMVSNITTTEKETRTVDFVTWKLQGILDGLDDDQNRKISRSEFIQILDDPDAVLALDEVGVDPIGIMDFADFIFDDPNDDDHGLAFGEFMEVVLKLRGTNTATVKDIVDLRKFVFSSIDQVQKSLVAPVPTMGRISLRGLPSSRPPSVTSVEKTCGGGGGSAHQLRQRIPSIELQPPEDCPDQGFVVAMQAGDISGGPAAECGRGLLRQPTASTDVGYHRESSNSSMEHGTLHKPPPPPGGEPNESEAMKRLSGRVQRLEESLGVLLQEVRRMNRQLPPIPSEGTQEDASASLGGNLGGSLGGTLGASLGWSGDTLTNLLHQDSSGDQFDGRGSPSSDCPHLEGPRLVLGSNWLK